jgi:hypothetical protein
MSCCGDLEAFDSTGCKHAGVSNTLVEIDRPVPHLRAHVDCVHTSTHGYVMILGNPHFLCASGSGCVDPIQADAVPAPHVRC